MDPLVTLADWIDEATQRGAPEPVAMALATVAAGVPSLRIVLCRGVDARGIRFFTNYESRKGRELGANAHAAATFFWPLLERQVRLEGLVERLPCEESDVYFASRPRGHRIGAWTSPQSQPIATIDQLRQEAAALAAKYEGQEVPRPPQWGGYVLRPSAVELWIAGRDRLHDRTRFERAGEGWSSTQLAP